MLPELSVATGAIESKGHATVPTAGNGHRFGWTNQIHRDSTRNVRTTYLYVVGSDVAGYLQQ